MKAQDLFKTAPITVILLSAFVALFLWQVLSGVDANSPNTQDLLKWGANALPLTMSNEPWRLVSSAFLHIGLMHLLFNAFAMYYFGQVAEMMFGRWQFLTIFLLSAIGGNLLNSYVTWHEVINEHARVGVSAGASGGIMGIGAGLLMAAMFRLSLHGVQLDFKNLIFIMAINLLYGFVVSGVDNAGHIGGAITGAILAFGIILPYFIPEKWTYHKLTNLFANGFFWVLSLSVTLIFLWFWWDLHQQVIKLI